MKKILKKVGAVLLALTFWQLAAMRIQSNILLVTPVAVIQRLTTIWREPLFWNSIWFSFYHVALGFALGLLTGILLAALAARFALVETLLWPWMAAAKSVPVASIVVICLIWLSNRNLSVFIAFLVVVPVVYQNIRTGLDSTDIQLEEMASVFHMRRWSYFRYILAPQLFSYLMAACRVTLGMAWKAAIAAEIIGAPAGSIGKMMYLSKIYLDTDDLLAWTVIIVALEIFSENLSKAYDEKKVLEHYSAIIREHQCSGIMGRSGSGKTTLLRILMGLEQADEGSIQGKLDRVSVVFQEDRLCEGFSAVANVSAALSRKVTRKQVEENLKTVGLEDSLNVPVRTLSDGMKRRVAIVRACMAEGDLLLFDEPIRGLDQETKRQVAEYIRRKTRGKTVIMTTHDEAELELMHSSQILRFPQ